jgi:hypothetical protein
MRKRLVKLTESDLHRIVRKSVNRILREGMGDSVDTLAQLLTDLDENTAQFVAGEMEFAYQNGYGFDEMVQFLSEKLDPRPYNYDGTGNYNDEEVIEL